MTASRDDMQAKLVAAFSMPAVASPVSRISTITNAFVSSIIPVVVPTPDEIQEALRILEADANDVRCVYCGFPATEWDHLRPLVKNRQPTGYISEIANLVPSCNKCNQSKGNSDWRKWLVGNAAKSPNGRGIPGAEARAIRLEAFERWREPRKVDFEAAVGKAAWEAYWALCENVISELRSAQEVANDIRQKVGAAVVFG